MLRVSEHPSVLRKTLLAPLALTYAAGACLQRALWSLGAPSSASPSIPLVIIGSLRAGGAGKTAVTLELSRQLMARGKRVGILAYRIGKPSGRVSPVIEIIPASSWHESSDEAVMMARALGDRVRVFVTRNRARALHLLERHAKAFDVLLSDDGLMDTRLKGAFRVALVRPGESPGLTDLLPAGPYRLTARVLSSLDFVLQGPLSIGQYSANENEIVTNNDVRNVTRKKTGTFRRKIVLPEGFDFSRSYWLLCGLGHPEDFRRSLEARGVRVAGMSAGPDHGLPDLNAARKEARRAGAAGFLYTAKDGLKLEGGMAGQIGSQIEERITLSPEFLSAVEAFLASRSS